MSLALPNAKTWAAEAALTLSPCFYVWFHSRPPPAQQQTDGERHKAHLHTNTHRHKAAPVAHTCHRRLMGKYIPHRRHDNRIISHSSDPLHGLFLCMYKLLRACVCVCALAFTSISVLAGCMYCMCLERLRFSQISIWWALRPPWQRKGAQTG